MELKKKDQEFGGCSLQRNLVTFNSHLTPNPKPVEVNRKISIYFIELWIEISVSPQKSVLLGMMLN